MPEPAPASSQTKTETTAKPIAASPSETRPKRPQRPPGETGGHTVQPWEEATGPDPVAQGQGSTSRSTPPPDEDVLAAQPSGQQAVTTAATAATPVAQASEARRPNRGGNMEAARAAGDVPAATVVVPQAQPAAAPAAMTTAKPTPAGKPAVGAPTASIDPTQLIDAVSKRLAETFAKALRQSVSEAVQDCLAAPATPTNSSASSAVQGGAADPAKSKPAAA